ncbi:MAG: HD-GYP domain-containing protein [Defluviitaleaceae bacterium]|nr:HD-GYP domain-containing protein [Defluviitaleaceae bacterium]
MVRKKFDITLDEVKAGMITADYITGLNEKGQLITVVKPNSKLSELTIERMHRYNVKNITIFEDEKFTSQILLKTRTNHPKEDKEDKQTFQMTPLMQMVLEMEIDVPPVKNLMEDDLKEEAVTEIRTLFDIAKTDGDMTTAYRVVKELNNVVNYLVDTISSESNAVVHITDLKSYDEYTYHHSLSVAVLAIAIGQGLGIDSDKLKKLGNCAIMHDIGKTKVPLELINKPGRLTKEEFDIVKQHANNGRSFLERCDIGDFELWAAVAHHHEKVDGSGYPKGLKGDEIPLFSQIISIGDVYDAVTSYRAYRLPMSPADAIELVMSEIGRSFDYDIVNVFVGKLELYPVNSIVQLSDKRLAIVVENTNSMRPIVRTLDNGVLLDLMGLNNLNLIITEVMNLREIAKEFK